MRNSTSKGIVSRFAELSRRGGGVRAVKLALCTALLAAAAGAQSSAGWRIDTFAGLPESGDGGPAVHAQLRHPTGVVVDGAGNLYIADWDYHRIRKVDSSGIITTIAGTGEYGFGGDDGPATEARLAKPTDVALDGSGNLYIADSRNHRIRKVDSTGTITTIAGTGEIGLYAGGFGGDGGPAVEALLDVPSGVAMDGAGNLYIADGDNHRIRKVDAIGTITTIAGTGESEFGRGGFGGDGGPAVQAQLSSPTGVALDGAGNLYIADSSNHRIRRVDFTGVITTVAGTGEFDFGGDGGPATQAQLNGPIGVALDGAGNLYIADTFSNRIRKVDSTGTITTIAGTGEYGFGGGGGGNGGPATQAQLGWPFGVALDGAGNLYIADTGNSWIRKIDSTGTITTIAGTGEYGFGGDGGPATQALLSSPTGVATDGAGNLYIADHDNHRIRRVDSTGTITTIAGTREWGFGGDGGPAVQAQLDAPAGVAIDGAGNLYIADLNSQRIRKVDYAGTITTVAGLSELRGFGGGGFSGDGSLAIEAQLNTPTGVATDGADNLYIADRNNNRIRKVDSTGVITTVVGSGEPGFGGGGFSGDGGLATEAHLKLPYGVALDGSGNLYIADSRNHRIRKVDSTGTITTIAGTGEIGFYAGGFGGDGGPAVEALLDVPSGVAMDGAGNLYIADRGNNRIRRVDSTGTITTIAGTGEPGYSGDGGPALQAQLNDPIGVATDGVGNLYIADTGNNRIRVLTRTVLPMIGPALAAILNAARFTPDAAPGSLQSVFGERLALETAAASASSLPEALGSVRIEIIDSTGAARAARLLYVSPGQINFLMPAEAAPGAAVLRLRREGEDPVESALTIGAVAPGLFSANGTGEGIGAITALRVGADGSRSNPAVFRFQAASGRGFGVPLNLGSEGDRLFLTLFGTAIRGAGGAAAVRATIGDSEVPVLFAGAQGGFAGLDQVNIGPLPRNLVGAGEVNVVVTAAGTTSNTVTIVVE